MPTRERRAASRLSALVSDPAGLDLAVRFVDRVARPDDLRVAARELDALGTSAAGAFLGPVDRALLATGARAAAVAPWVVVPAARARLRQLVGHLVVDDGPALAEHLAALRRDGFAVNLNLLGEAVLGQAEADRRLLRIAALVARTDVEHVSVKVSAVVAHTQPWDAEGAAARVAQRLLPLVAAAGRTGTALTLDMEEHRDVDLTLGVLERLAAAPEAAQARLGVALQAYLPRTRTDLDRVVAAAHARREAGGAPLAVRLVKGANLAMEHVEAELHHRPPATFGTKPETDASYVALLDALLDPGSADALHVGVASHNAFHLALAVLLARARGVAGALRLEMLHGMAPALARAVRADHDRVLLYTPVAARQDFDVVVAYLVRRLEEAAAPQNFLAAVAGDGSDGLGAQEEAFRAAVHDAGRSPATPAGSRHAAGAQDDARPAWATFRNAADTDLARASGRAPIRAALDESPEGADSPGSPGSREPSTTRAGSSAPRTLADTQDVDAAVAEVLAAAPAWAATPPDRRAQVLRRAADELERRRADLVAVMVAEAGKTVAEADPEVSEAVDFARYYADRALDLVRVRGAVHDPGRGITVVTPPWNFPVSITVGSALAALAAGSATLVKPAPQTPRCAELALDAVHAALHEAGAPAGTLVVARSPEGDVGRRLVTHPDVARVLLTGSIDTARLFARWSPQRPVLAETSGKNSVVVTPAADVDLAVADVVRSAFGHAGQKCSAASLLVLVGSAGRDPRLRRQLADAVSSLPVGPATDPRTVVGPLVGEPEGALLRALTRLDAGEEWLVRPRRLGPRLWTPGVRHGVVPGSWFHRTECFGPVLGVVRVDTLDEAIDVQNAVPFGLTGGLHSLDDAEIDRWLDRVEVGNAYVNRTVTGAVVGLQPFGGWKQSVVGPGAKAGGPHYVAQLGTWSDAPDVPADDAGWLAWARDDDARAWSRLALPVRLGRLAGERDELRLRPLPAATLRVGDQAPPRAVERVRHAARTVGVALTTSDVASEPHDAFAARVASGEVTGRIRAVGLTPGLREAAAEHAGLVTVLDAPVVASAERELLAFVREQSVSRTVHRYGHVPRDVAVAAG